LEWKKTYEKGLTFHRSFANISQNVTRGEISLAVVKPRLKSLVVRSSPLKQRPSILFVDDHEDTRFLISHLLGNWGYEVNVARCLGEGLRLARAGGFDLYLLDSRFADGSGAELCESIRKFDKVTPIVFYSGDHPSRLKKALECDAQGFVLKPGFDALPRELERALGSPA
jgi:two-component system phosphate regulon response regulator PhoB